jgi:5-methylcytosine-specific restriction protein A
VIPHRGDPALFWPDANVQTLCKPCHDRRKQAEESAARAAGR